MKCITVIESKYGYCWYVEVMILSTISDVIEMLEVYYIGLNCLRLHRVGRRTPLWDVLFICKLLFCFFFFYRDLDQS
jgi:hypothetical protein